MCSENYEITKIHLLRRVKVGAGIFFLLMPSTFGKNSEFIRVPKQCVLEQYWIQRSAGGGRGARNMKSMWLPLAVIFFMTYFYRAGGHDPSASTGSATVELRSIYFFSANSGITIHGLINTPESEVRLPLGDQLGQKTF